MCYRDTTSAVESGEIDCECTSEMGVCAAWAVSRKIIRDFHQPVGGAHAGPGALSCKWAGSGPAAAGLSQGGSTHQPTLF